MTALTTKESSELSACEEVIQRGLSNFIEVGNALAKIRDRKLYRGGEWDTFEDYCREKWGMSRIHAFRLMESAAVSANLLPTGNIPASERVARPLAKLPPTQQTEVWKEALKTAPNGKVTAAHVEQTVKRVTVADDEEVTQRAEEAEQDSENLWSLKSTWRRCSKRDKQKFKEWIQTNQ